MLIEAERLTVRRLGRAVLRQVGLRIKPGQCLSIIGPNGAGKSTLMAAIAGLLPLAEGSVRIGGDDIRRMKRRQIARRLAYVPQVHEGYLGFRVRDVVEAGRYAYVDPLSPLSEEDRAAVERAVADCRIGHLMDRPVETLSGGERQKAWIAAALAQQTPILLLDEPTSALDPAHQLELIRIMRRSLAGGSTLVVISHELNLPLVLGGRVLALRDGEVFFNEPVEVLQDTARLADLFAAPFTLHRDAAGTSLSLQLAVEGG